MRRSDRLWAGLSPDLVIEQVLMRSIKTVGGLTRGRGMNDLQHAIWLLSTPVTVDKERYSVDPQLFFQRPVVFIRHADIEKAFSYELCTKPSSLLDKRGLLNEANKPSLMNALAEIKQPAEYLGVPSGDKYVIDGGWLLQQIQWRK